MSITPILAAIQQKLKAPKGQVNSFGNYKYRNCEDILEAVKPLLGEAVVLLSDEIIMVGDRVYVKATATLRFEEWSVSVSASARESLDKKGMDTAQITGAASSYARKYALNGLFLIDDTKDADSKDNSGTTIPTGTRSVSKDDQKWIDAVRKEPKLLDTITNQPYRAFIESKL